MWFYLGGKLFTVKVNAQHFEALHGLRVGEDKVLHLVGDAPHLAFLYLLDPEGRKFLGDFWC